MFEYSFICAFSYQTKNQSHKKIIRETTGWNNQNQINVCHSNIKAHNQIQKFKNNSWILFSLNLKISFDNHVQKASVHTKNQAQSINNSNSLITYVSVHIPMRESFILRFRNQNNKAPPNKKIANIHTENFLFLKNR